VVAAGSDKAIAAIMKWSTREEWLEQRQAVAEEHLGPICEGLELSPLEISDVLGREGFGQLMGCAFEDFLTCRFEPDQRNVVDDYLRRRGWKESVPGKRYLRALQESIMSIYEVTDTVAGSHFWARDMVRGGEPIRVEDKLASENLIRWDRIAARLLPIGGKTYLSGGTLWLSFEDAREVVEEIVERRTSLDRRLRRRAKRLGFERADLDALPIDDAILSEATPLFTQTWLATMLRRALGRAMSEISNFDGETLVLSETRFPVADPATLGEIEARLDRLSDLVRDEPGEPHWTWSLPLPRQQPSPGRKRGTSPEPLDPGERRILGTVLLRDDALLLQTNSVERADRGRELLACALGALVGPPLTSMQTPEQVMADLPEAGPMEQTELPLAPADAAVAIKQVLDRHYREALKSPVPMLGDRSPKQAVRSKSGRRQVAEWLKYLENQSTHRAGASGEPCYDFTWMWEALGIADLRR
jgi:hypothetical protein